jgi:hypothetical protein
MEKEVLNEKQNSPVPPSDLGKEDCISEWLLAQFSLDLLRQQVYGVITAKRHRECIPYLKRYFKGSRRQRTHWFTQVRRWLRNAA